MVPTALLHKHHVHIYMSRQVASWRRHVGEPTRAGKPQTYENVTIQHEINDNVFYVGTTLTIRRL